MRESRPFLPRETANPGANYQGPIARVAFILKKAHQEFSQLMGLIGWVPNCCPEKFCISSVIAHGIGQFAHRSAQLELRDIADIACELSREDDLAPELLHRSNATVAIFSDGTIWL
jgi:hypothetical protein